MKGELVVALGTVPANQERMVGSPGEVLRILKVAAHTSGR